MSFYITFKKKTLACGSQVGHMWVTSGLLSGSSGSTGVTHFQPWPKSNSSTTRSKLCSYGIKKQDICFILQIKLQDSSYMCISNIVHMYPVATFLMAPFLFHARMFVKDTIYIESKTSSV